MLGTLMQRCFELSCQNREEEQAVQTALAWIEEHYPEEVGAAVHYDFMDEPDDERTDAIDALSPRLEQAISVNIGEWLLADAELGINGNDVKAHELILGKVGRFFRPWPGVASGTGKAPLVAV